MTTIEAYTEERLKAFEEAYREGLWKAIKAAPDNYLIKDADVVTDKMMKAVRERGIGSVTIYKSEGFKNACKALGINKTYSAIENYLAGN